MLMVFALVRCWCWCGVRFDGLGPCMWPPASRWNEAVAPLKPAVEKNIAPSFMGGIHPRQVVSTVVTCEEKQKILNREIIL